MTELTIFANFFIDTKERFIRVQDSLNSFKHVDAKCWVINVRGRYRAEVTEILRGELGPKLLPFGLNRPEGWFHDSRSMLPSIEGDCVLFWLEDHLSMVSAELLDQAIVELDTARADYMMYTFWWDGRLRERYAGLELSEGTLIDTFIHDIEANQTIQNNVEEEVFIIPACSIFRRELFEKIILADDPIPKRWPIQTPFDFEKRGADTHWLPLKVALPKQELFASIDDDHVHPGSSLISRGLYTRREQRQSYAMPTSPLTKRLAKALQKKP
ncbi:hypothetical protein ACFL1S_00175 [Pseudomonadota bacterium]